MVEGMTGPTQTCLVCGTVEPVTPDGRGFPPDIAKHRLAKICRANGHVSRPAYRAGLSTRLPKHITSIQFAEAKDDLPTVYRPQCSCGWHGGTTRSLAAANKELETHL